jgi:hypothetical protein
MRSLSSGFERMLSEQTFFDDLERRASSLHASPERDNEATRHDLLIHPLLVSPFGLQWDPTDLISQSTISVPREIANSHLFRKSIPKLRRPDILIFPKEVARRIAVVEEKERQCDIQALNWYRLQLAEYQALYECTWGLLTDGEKWIVKKNFETFHQFQNISELRVGIRDLRQCIGKHQVISRILKHNTSDLVLVVNSAFPLVGDIKATFHSDLYGFYDDVPIIVCGVISGMVTENGSGVEHFQDLRSALITYPDIHPRICTKRFTWAMKETGKGRLVTLRFETWPANDFYST